MRPLGRSGSTTTTRCSSRVSRRWSSSSRPWRSKSGISEAWVEASRAQAGLEQKLAAATLIYISGTVTIVAYTATLVGFRNRVVPLVEKVARKVQEGIDQGLNQAQAMAAASAEYIQAQDAIFFDLQVTVATEAFFSGLATGASHCGKIALDVINIAGDAIGPAVTKLFGKEKSGAGGKQSLTQKQGDETEAIFFLGESEDGSFENVPLGDFDLLVFRDGYVRGNVQDVSLQTCAVTQEVPVKMATLDEFFEDDPTDPGPTPDRRTTRELPDRGELDLRHLAWSRVAAGVRERNLHPRRRKLALRPGLRRERFLRRVPHHAARRQHARDRLLLQFRMDARGACRANRRQRTGLHRPFRRGGDCRVGFALSGSGALTRALAKLLPTAHKRPRTQASPRLVRSRRCLLCSSWAVAIRSGPVGRSIRGAPCR